MSSVPPLAARTQGMVVEYQKAETTSSCVIQRVLGAPLRNRIRQRRCTPRVRCTNTGCTCNFRSKLFWLHEPKWTPALSWNLCTTQNCCCSWFSQRVLHKPSPAVALSQLFCMNSCLCRFWISPRRWPRNAQIILSFWMHCHFLTNLFHLCTAGPPNSARAHRPK